MGRVRAAYRPAAGGPSHPRPPPGALHQPRLGGVRLLDVRDVPGPAAAAPAARTDGLRPRQVHADRRPGPGSAGPGDDGDGSAVRRDLQDQGPEDHPDDGRGHRRRRLRPEHPPDVRGLAPRSGLLHHRRRCRLRLRRDARTHHGRRARHRDGRREQPQHPDAVHRYLFRQRTRRRHPGADDHRFRHHRPALGERFQDSDGRRRRCRPPRPPPRLLPPASARRRRAGGVPRRRFDGEQAETAQVSEAKA